MTKFVFSLQRFGGGKGGSQTTNNNYRPLTADELRMQKSSADYAEAIQPSAYNLFNRSMGMLGQPGEDTTVNPNYNSLYNQQAATTANLTNQYNNLNSDIGGMMGNYNDQVGAVNARNDANSSYVKGVGQAAAARTGANSQYLSGVMGNAANRSNLNSGLLGSETSLVNQQLRNGTIPQAVLNARQDTVNSMAQNALGSLLANNAASGTIGSDQFTDGLSGISKSVASTLNDSYSNDLNAYNNAMQQSLGNVGNYVNTDNSTAQQGVSNAGNYVNTDNAAAQQGVTNAGNWAQYDSNMAQQGLSNLGNAIQQQYNIGTGLLNQGSNMNALGLNQASQAQSASYATPLSLFGAATGQMQPTQQVWQPTLLSNQSNPISSTTTTSGGGGIFGGLLGGLAGNPGIFGK